MHSILWHDYRLVSSKVTKLSFPGPAICGIFRHSESQASSSSMVGVWMRYIQGKLERFTNRSSVIVEITLNKLHYGSGVLLCHKRAYEIIDIIKQKIFVALTNPKILAFGFWFVFFFKRIGAQFLVFGLDGYAILIPCHLTEVLFIVSCPKAILLTFSPLWNKTYFPDSRWFYLCGE